MNEDYDNNNNILVMYDRDYEFRKFLKKQLHVKNNREVEWLSRFHKNCSNKIVIAIRSNIDTEWLDLLGDMFNPSAEERDRFIVAITADEMRKHNISITELGSIEQAVHEVILSLKWDPVKKIIEKITNHLVVIFRETAAVYINVKELHGSFHFCPNYDWKAQLNAFDYGFMPGKFSIALAALVKYLAQSNSIEPSTIPCALRAGIVAYNDYFDTGFCLNNTRRSSDVQSDSVNINKYSHINTVAKC